MGEQQKWGQVSLSNAVTNISSERTLKGEGRSPCGHIIEDPERKVEFGLFVFRSWEPLEVRCKGMTFQTRALNRARFRGKQVFPVPDWILVCLDSPGSNLLSWDPVTLTAHYTLKKIQYHLLDIFYVKVLFLIFQDIIVLCLKRFFYLLELVKYL